MQHQQVNALQVDNKIEQQAACEETENPRPCGSGFLLIFIPYNSMGFLSEQSYIAS